MNLVEALNAALPELPAKRKSNPKLHPKLIWKEHIQDEQPVIAAFIPGIENLFTFSPQQWQLLQLFDGSRSYAQVALDYQAQSGVEFSEADVREFAANLEESGFFYGMNTTLAQKLSHERQHHAQKKSKWGDLSLVYLNAWDPDGYFTWLHQKVYWVYDRWCVALVMVMFAFTAYVFIDRWSEIWGDTVKYYTFTEKSGYELLEFWLLFFALGFFHESAHGLTCKHFGGEVHRMGALLIYLTGAFYVDVTEVWVYGGKWQRIATIIAGIYTELIICSLATMVWWGTAPGAFAHEWAYKIMLVTGVAVVIINMNPLIKLDGYYVFSELVGIGDLKEASTAFVSAWVQHNIFRLPVEVPFVTARRRWLFVPYALISGLYSYALLFAVARLAYNIFHSFSPDWAFVPAAALAFVIFRSRLRTLGRFMKTLYLDKKEKVLALLTRPRLAALGVAVLVLLFAPVWRDTASGRFLLEPGRRAVVRAEVPGAVARVFADEGQPVAAGAVLASLRNLDLDSEAERATADYQLASANAVRSQLRYVGFGPAEQERQRLRQRSALMAEQRSKLEVRSPIAGVVATPRLRDLLGSYLEAGKEVAQVLDLSTVRGRIYIPESEVRDIRVGAPARLHFDGLSGSRAGSVSELAPASTDIGEGLMAAQPYKGIRPPPFYVATVELPNPNGSLRDGMTGDAKILVTHRSLAGFLWRTVSDFAGRKIW